ncbi:hypothetical protein Aglo01_23580 [Actinokineospora globicatena]|nr:hypothetical protein Aglo01_23580 [Actinokineospora globicatena]
MRPDREVEQPVQVRHRDVGVAGARVQVDQVVPRLEQRELRDLGGGQRAAGRVRDRRRPLALTQPSDSSVESVTRGVEVLADHPRLAARAVLDVGVAVGPTGVRRVLDLGPRPGQQVDQRVGVAREVADHVRPRPAGEQARLAERRVRQVGDHPVQHDPRLAHRLVRGPGPALPVGAALTRESGG